MTDKTATVNVTATVIGLVTAILGVLKAFGVNITADQYAAITTLAGAILVAAAFAWRLWGIGKDRVVEQTPDGVTVLAGPANELPTGSLVRADLGETNPKE